MGLPYPLGFDTHVYSLPRESVPRLAQIGSTWGLPWSISGRGFQPTSSFLDKEGKKMVTHSYDLTSKNSCDKM